MAEPSATLVIFDKRTSVASICGIEIGLGVATNFFTQSWPPWLSEEVNICPQRAPTVLLEQGACSGQSMEEMNSSSGSCAKTYLVFFSPILVSGGCPSSWWFWRHFMLCQIHLNLPLVFPTVHYKSCITWVFTYELVVPDNLSMFQPVLPVAWNTAVFQLLEYFPPCVLFFSQILHPYQKRLRRIWLLSGSCSERCWMCRWYKAFCWPLLAHRDVHRWGYS